MRRKGGPVRIGSGKTRQLVAATLVALALAPGLASAISTLGTVKVSEEVSAPTPMETVRVTAPRGSSGGGIVNFDAVRVIGVRGGGRIPTLGVVSAIRPNLGDLGAPSQSRDPEMPCDQTTGAAMTAGNPVVFSTGNKVEFETDFAADVEMGLSLTRTYNHYWTGTGIFGRHWLSNFDYSLASAEPGPNAANIWLQRPDGRSIKFQRTALGRWEEAKAQAIAYVTLSGNVYTHNSEDGLVEQYNANGYITRLASRQGVAWTFSYSNNYLQRVTHTSGRYVQFTWTNGQLTKVTDPGGNAYTFTYTANALGSGRHRLATANPPGTPGTTVQYHYEDARFPGGLTGKSFNGLRYSNFAYDANGRATLSEHAGGVERYTFAYELNPSTSPAPPPPPPPPAGGSCDPNTGRCTHPLSIGDRLRTAAVAPMAVAASAPTGTIRRTVVTNPLGKQTSYEFENGRLIATIGLASAHCAAASKAIVYDANGYPSIAEDFNGNKTYTTYNAKAQLLELREAVGTPVERTTTYAWSSTNRMTRQTLPGQVETTWTYDSKDRLTSVAAKNLSANGVAGQARKTTFAYTVHGNGMLASTTVDGPIAGTADQVVSRYDATGALTAQESSIGAVTFADHNALGQPGKVTGLNGDVAEFAYDARGRLVRARRFPTGTAADTTYRYLSSGLLGAVTRPDGQVRTYAYDAARRLVAESEPEDGGSHAVIEYTLDPMSLVTQTVVRSGLQPAPPDSTIRGVIDGVAGSESAGYVVRGWACASYYDAPIPVHMYLGGPAGAGIGFSGYIADLPSDPGVAEACESQGTAHRFNIPITTAMRQQHGGKTIYVHGISPVGGNNLTIAASGSFRIPAIQSTNPPPNPPPGGGGWCNPNTGICQQPVGIEIDIVSGPQTSVGALSSTDGIAYRRIVDYDELGRVRGVRGNNGQLTTYTYDLNGSVLTEKNAYNHVTTHHYDALNRLVRTVNALGYSTYYEYNALDLPTKVTDPRGNATSYVIDGFGQVLKQTSPDTGVTTFQFNAAGLNTRMTRNDGSWLTYTYDGLGRLTGATSGSDTLAYGYDWCGNGKGRLCNADSPTSTRHFGYTPEGAIAITRDVTPSSDDWTHYAYDAVGRLGGISYASGTSVGYGYHRGRLAVIQATINGVTRTVADQFKYSPTGAMTRMMYGNATVKDREYDLDGRLTITHDHGWLGHTYGYNALDEVTSIQNWSRTQYNQNFGYDPLSRLTSIASPVGNQSFTFDANGNRTLHQWDHGEGYQVASNSNRMTVAANQTLVYDGRGNRARQQFVGSTTIYDYDGFNRLVSVQRDVAASYTNPNYADIHLPAGTTTYAINALGQRTAKSGPLGSARFVYGGQNTLMSEVTGGQWTDHIWMGSEPIGFVRGGQLYFTHADRLGRPEIVTDTSGRHRWYAANYAYDRAVLGSTIGDYNLGFPGQYYDAETGFWYNGFRDYDGRTGTYLQSDPIGLNGGMNTYSYVQGNPNSFVDPLGLVGWSGTITIGSGGRGGAGAAMGIASLTSECVNGQMVSAKVALGGAGVAIGSPVALTVSQVTLTGGNIMYPDASDLEGEFYMAGASFAVGGGASAINLRIGSVASAGVGGQAGWDASMSLLYGGAKIMGAPVSSECGCGR
ncbi:RHS repeat-associated core domain-containing protein [Luteimonas sp. RC10]|uniref:RHS repeat-associated core domain-containing protein n=1 Tax=Luteimonas sp. RC10 TaxID=2587035 RepID=UPI0016085F93|nr:RHS repeat-associated core domain-containing protein [Luteimonas sp. RC10]MBB3344728.1 RHS repeat-associated protein [Luteimonas sp. RC10]